MNKFIFFLFMLSCYNTAAQPFEIPLDKGQYTVGFKTYWKFDHSRFYDASGLDSTIKKQKAAKPVLLQVWYPAEKPVANTPMIYGKYLLPVQDPGTVAGFYQSFISHGRQMAVKEIFGNEEKKLVPEESLLLQKVLSTKTNAYYSCKPVNKKFPLIIYHPGFGASLDDNILFCEFLASHGYIVISSSFFKDGGNAWGADGRMGSVRDISFILSNAAIWEPNADLNNCAMMGHSAGAQAAHIAMAQGSLVFKAMVSMETTQEYHTLVNKLWNNFVTPTLLGIDRVKGDLLFIATPGAIFQLADSMKNANRYYYTIPGVRHNDFISQGIIHNYVKREMKKTNANDKDYAGVAADYRDICSLILSFFDSKLKNDTKTFELYYQKDITCTGTKLKCMEFMPKGRTNPEPYINREEPPTIRQFRQLLVASPKAGIDLMKKWYINDASLGIFDFSFAFAIVDELFETGRIRDAVLLYSTYKELGGQLFVNDYKGKCDFYNTVSGQPKDASDKKIKILSGE